MPRYVKLDKMESLPTDNAVEDITKSLQDWVWEAYKKAIKEQIVANTVLIDKHFAKTNRIFVSNLNIPPMICGLEIKVTEELPDGYNFALVEALETERDRIIKNATKEVAREIFEEIERFLYMHFRFCKEESGNDDTKYLEGRLELNTQMQDLIAELKKKYAEE